MMSGSLSAAMERGCWCELQGAYFANWKADRMVIPYAEVKEQWWDTHFISLDYGFGKSSAAAHLHVRTQDGRLYTIGEYVAAHQPAYQFGQEVIARFIAPEFQGQRRRIVVIYLDPANFNPVHDIRIGTGGHSVSDQINEVLAPWDLAGIRGSNDRIGGWQLMYQMLSRGEWQIADTCPRLIEAIPSRMHDDKKPGDLLKVPGDPLDDVADSARYGIYSFVTGTEKPTELRVREAIRPLAEAGDLTSALIRYNQMMEDSRYTGRPIVLGRHGRRR